MTANPYFVVTCFDELVRTKGVALIRGDVVGGMNKDEAQAMLNTLLNSYLVDHFFDRVRKFNHEPNQFNFEQYTQDAIGEFHQAVDHVKKTKTPPMDIG